MNKFKGTPGPWYLDKTTTQNQYGVTVFKINSSDVDELAHVHEVFTIKEGKANAKLIACAPTLLKALQECRDTLALCTMLDKSGQAEKAVNMADEIIIQAL